MIVRNRAAAFHYEITEKLEAGIVLKGSEVKSLRAGGASLVEAYATLERGEAWIKQMHIASFVCARAFPHAEFGTRKLLLHAKEIRHLERAVMREGYTLIPLDLHFKDGYVKVTLGVGRGRKSPTSEPSSASARKCAKRSRRCAGNALSESHGGMNVH